MRRVNPVQSMGEALRQQPSPVVHSYAEEQTVEEVYRGAPVSTIRVAKRQRFAVVDRRAVNDERLSLSARGLLVWALDKPDDFELTREQIARQVPEGETAIRRMLKELTDAGYLVRERKRDEAG